MVFVDFAGSVALGQLTALGARASLERSSSTLSSPPFAYGLAFATLIYLPAVAYFMLRWPALDWVYLVEPSPELNALFLGSIPAGFVLGFASTHRLLRRRLVRWALAAFGGVVLLGATALGVFWERSIVVAESVSDYERGLGIPYVDSDAPITSAIAMGTPALGFLALWWVYRRRFDTRPATVGHDDRSTS